MLRTYFLFKDWSGAAQFRDAVDDALGLPAPGVRIGGGARVPADEGWSVTWDLLLAHPSRKLWAYRISEKLRSRLPGHRLLSTDEAIPLNPAWSGATSVMPNLERLPLQVRPIYEQRYAADVAARSCAFFDVHSPTTGVAHTASLVTTALVERFANDPTALRVMNRRLFEELVAEIWHRFGYDVHLTKQTRDGGYDVLAVQRHGADARYLIECKRPDPGNTIGVRPVRELYGVKKLENATAAVLVTTSSFTSDARSWAERCHWELELRDYEGLLDWLSRTRRQA